MSAENVFISFGSRERTAFRSAPAQKQPPAPVKMATLADASLSNSRKAFASASAVGRLTQFLTSGLLELINKWEAGKRKEVETRGFGSHRGKRGPEINQKCTD